MSARTYDKSNFKAIFHPKGHISYNGFVFNELVKTKLEITPIENHARTGIKYEEYLFTIEAFISPDDVRAARLAINYDNLSNGITRTTVDEIFESSGVPVKNRTSAGNTNIGSGLSDVDSTDANFRLLRQHLMQPGGDFIFGNKGAGEDLVFISTGTESWSSKGVRKDICFGPMPKILSFEPIAGNSFARIVFQLLVRFKTCPFTKSYGIVDFSLTTSIKTNPNGYKQINRKGYLEVTLPRVRTGSNAKSFSIDTFVNYDNENRIEEKYKDILNNLIGVNMQGYKVEHEVSFSPDHRSCEFSIKYTEIESPNAYPNGVTKISANHGITSSLMGEGGKLEGGGFSKWLNSMSATITLRPNVPPVKAWFIFLELLNERLQYDIDVLIKHGRIDRVKVPMILEMSLEESLFSHEYKFNVKWVTWIENISQILTKTGMFQPIQSTNWFDWTTDMRLAANSVNGAFPLVPGKNGSDYHATNLCNDQFFNTHYDLNLETTRGYPPEFIYSLFGTKCPPQSSSMIDYQEKFYVVGGISRSTYQRYEPSTVNSDISRTDNLSESPNYNDTFEMLDKYLDAPESSFFTQDFGRDQYKIVHRGYAVRLGYAFSPPKLSLIGGKKVELLPDADIITTQPKSTSGDCPIIVTTWERHYKILGKPSGDLSRSNKQSGRSEEYQP